jgi:DNA polymerase-1
MERWGVAIDTGALAKLAGQFAASLQTLEQEIHTLAGREFNINSPTQLGEILGELNLSTARKTKTGKISTSAEVLEELAAEHPLPAKVLEYREIAKLQNTYVEALPRLINPATGRIHTTINQTGTATGRLSSTNPNLQNIPVRSELGRSIRQAFIAGAGYQLMSADYSQIELRLLAHIAADPVMTTAFQHHEDIHTKTAREVFGAQTDEEVKAKRRLAKATNFGIAYGVGAFGLAERVGISRSEAKVAIENYYATYPGIRHYMTNTPEQARQDNGVVRTLLGRIRRLPGLTERQHNLRARAEREAINAPIQGTAADLVKLAMIKIYQRLRRERRQARLLLQVHDELLLEVPPAEVEAVQRLVTEEMETVYPLNVPLLVAVHVGNNWRDLK